MFFRRAAGRGRPPLALDPEASDLLASRDPALAAARVAIRDSTSLTRLLTILSDEAPLHVLLDRALSALSELFLADVVVLLDPAGTGLYSPLAAVGLPEEYLGRPLADGEDGCVAKAMHTERPHLTTDMAREYRKDCPLKDMGVVTAVWLPLLVEQASRGVLLLARCREEAFTQDEADLLMVMAHRIALALEQAQLHAQFEQITRAGRAIGDCHLDKSRVQAEVVRNFSPVVGAQAAALVLRSPDGELACACHTHPDPAWREVAVSLAEGLLAGPALDRGEVFSTSDAAAARLVSGSTGALPVRALLAAPIQREGGTCGVLLAVRPTATRFTSCALQAARIYAAQASMFLENAELYWRVSEELAERRRTEQALQLAKQEAEAANRAKADFLANMSHELRTPLNGVLSMLQLMGQKGLDPERAMLLKTAQESSWSLLSIINDLLCFVQIEAGKISFSHEPMEPLTVLDTVIRAMAPDARARGLALRQETAPGIPARVQGDANRLRQVFTNLVSNALKFTEQGEVVVRAAVLPHELPDGHRLLLFSVQDTGVGIPDDKVAAAFEPFTQVDSSLSRRFQGTGIGLGIVRYLVSHMGGTIAVESEVGRGSTFHFTIRCGPAEALAAAGEAPAEDPGPAGLHVLLVEDDRVNRFAATRFLERLGCTVVAAANGREALEALEREDFAAVFMDVQMPEMDGIEATRAIRRSAAQSIPIIAMTAHALAGDRERFLAAGMDDYIPKPVDMQDMARVLAELRARRP